jgi:ABC-type hemin transport system substrate-binding protein
MNTPIASPIPSGHPVANPLFATLANQICDLTHVVDKLERSEVTVMVYPLTIQSEIDTLHSIIDALNVLYTSLEKAQSDINSLERRLKWAQYSAEKHHNGNIAACEREVKVRDALVSLLGCAELNQDEMEIKTRDTIDTATRALVGN